jgi:hypothetical protein
VKHTTIRFLTHNAELFEGEEIVNAPGKDGNASMPEQVKRPNPWRRKKRKKNKNKKMMMILDYTV